MQIQQHWHQVHILSVTTTHTNTVQHGGMQIQQHWHQVHVLSVTTTCTNNREIIAEFWEMRFGSHRYYVTKKSLAQCSYKKNPEMFNLNLWFVCTRMLNCNCLDLQWLTDSYISLHSLSLRVRRTRRLPSKETVRRFWRNSAHQSSPMCRRKM